MLKGLQSQTLSEQLVELQNISGEKAALTTVLWPQRGFSERRCLCQAVNICELKN